MNYLPVILWCLIGLVGLLTLLGALAGFFKGLIKTTVKTLIKLILVIIFAFTSPAIAQAVGNIDFSSLGKSFTVNGTLVHLTTLLETLANVITATGMVSPMNGISLYSTAMAVSLSLLSYAIFLALMILAQLLISLITAIVYNAFFRWALPVENGKDRKRIKKETKNNKVMANVTHGLIDANGGIQEKQKFRIHRGWGALLGAVQEFIFACAMLAPITALARTAIVNTKTGQKDASGAVISYSNNYGNLYQLLVKTNQIQDSDRPSGDSAIKPIYRSDYDKTISIVENSWIYKLLGVGNFDTNLLSQVSKTTINGQQVSFSTLVNATLNVASPLLESDALTYETGSTQITVNYATLLSTNMVETLITGVLNNKAVTSLIPPLIDVAMNYASAKGNIPLSQFDFSNVDWTSDLTILRDIYSVIYNYGLTSMISADGTALKYNDFAMATAGYDDDTISTISNALGKLGALDSVKKNMGVIFAGLGTYFNSIGYDILSTDPADYSAIDWSHDLATAVSSALRLFRLFGLNLSSSLFQTRLDFSDNNNVITQAVKTVLKDSDKRKVLKEIITGDDGLLSLGLVSTLRAGNALQAGLSSVSALSSYTSTEAFLTTVQELNHVSGETAEASQKINDEISNEISVAFSLADILFNKDSPLSYWTLADLQKTASSEMTNKILSYLTPDICNEIVSLLDLAEKSNVFNSMYASILKTFLLNYYQSGTTTSYFFGLSPYDFNYEASDFTSSLKKVIALAPSLKTIYTTMNDQTLSVEDKLGGIDTATLRQFLAILANSDFFNQDSISSATSQSIRNKNIHTVLASFFEDTFLKNYNITIPDSESMSDITWGDGTKSSDATAVNGEIDALMSTLEDIQVNKEFFSNLYTMAAQGETFSEDMFSSLDTDSKRTAFFNTFLHTNQSKILATIAVTKVCDVVQAYFDKNGIPFSLNDLRNYADNPSNQKHLQDDLIAFRSLIPLINKIGFHNLILDFSNLQARNADYDYSFLKLDDQALNALATAFVNSNFYAEASQSHDMMSGIAYGMIGKMGFFTTYGFTDFGSAVLDPKTYNRSWSEAMTSVAIEGKVNNDDGTSSTVTKNYEITTQGEISSFMAFFRFIQKLGVKDILAKQIPTLPSSLDGWLSGEDSLTLFSDPYFRNLMVIEEPSLINELFTSLTSLPASGKACLEAMDVSSILATNSDGSYVYDGKALQKEAAVFFKLIKQVKAIGISNLKGLSDRVTSLTDKELESLDIILDTMDDSFLLTSVKKGETLSPLAKAISVMINKMAESSDTLLLRMTLTDALTEAKDVLRSELLTLDQTAGWTKELGSLSQVLHAIQGMDYLSSDMYAKGRSYDTMLPLVSAMNQSLLLHRFPISLMREAITKVNGLTPLLENNGVLTHPLDFQTHLTNSADDQAYWLNDETMLLTLFYKDSSFSKAVKDNTDFTKIDFSASGLSTSFFYYLGKTHLFHYNRSYVLKNLIDHYKDDTGTSLYGKIFLSSTHTPYGEDAQAWRLEDLFFANSKLLGDDGTLDETKALSDTKMIDAVLDKGLSHVDSLGKATSLAEIYEALKNNDGSFTYFSDLTSQTLRLDTAADQSTSLYRSDFASEIVAGALTIITRNSNLAKAFGTLSGLDFYANSYELVNPIEGQVIDSLILLGKDNAAGTSQETASNVVLDGTITTTVDGVTTTTTVPIPLATYRYYPKSYLATLFSNMTPAANQSTLSDYLLANDAAYAVKNSQLAVILATAKKDTNTFSYAYQGQTIVFGPYSALGKLPVLLAGSKAAFLGDVLDFTKLSTTTLTQLLSDNTSLQ